jgi:hypothetical protein
VELSNVLKRVALAKKNCELSDANVFEEQTLDFDDWNVKQHWCCLQKKSRHDNDHVR